MNLAIPAAQASKSVSDTFSPRGATLASSKIADATHPEIEVMATLTALPFTPESEHSAWQAAYPLSANGGYFAR